MPLNIKDDTPTKFPNPNYLTMTNWKRGVITLIDKSRLPKDALAKADNCFLYEDGQPGPRPGVNWFGSVSPNGAAISGFDYFDFAGVVHLVMVAGGNVYRSTDDGTTWTLCSGGTTISGTWVNMNQNGAYLYLTDGVDNILRYDGSTTLVSYTALTTPSAPTSTPTPASPGTGYTYYYKIAAVNTVGFSAASTKVTVTHGVPRSSWDDTTNFITLTLPAYQTSQTRNDIYWSEDDLNYFYLDSTSTPDLVYKDNGTAIPVPSTLAPTANTTQGPLVTELTNVGSRMYGVRDTANRYRIWFSGAGAYAGSFSNAYDGGYLDWQKGGKYIPVHVEDYRDGKGTPLATIWCSSADGQGCILQMSLDTLTVGDISITVPSAYKLPGSRGTPSPSSVVNVLNDYYFYNSQAFYNLGSRAQFLNLLSTDEASANIRPTVQTVNAAAETNIASAYNLAKVYFSVPLNGSTTNNTTIVYDTERKAWLPTAFTIGFSKFLRYTTTGNAHKLLALKPGDTQLSEISGDLTSDYGTAFVTDIYTGLYPTVPSSRFEFEFTERAELEMSNPASTITAELLGIERSQGYSTQVSKTFTPTVESSGGWDTSLWDTVAWDDTSAATTVVAESSFKRYFPVNRELNAVQWHITSNAVGVAYIVRTLQTWGTPTQAGLPPTWRLN